MKGVKSLFDLESQEFYSDFDVIVSYISLVFNSKPDRRDSESPELNIFRNMVRDFILFLCR